MTDYYPLMSRAVSDLPQSSRQTRDAVYKRAHSALVDQLASRTPPASRSELAHERRSLQEAINKVEEEAYAKQRALGVSFAATAFHDPTTITRLLKTLLWISIALDVIAFGSRLVELQLLKDMEVKNYIQSDMISAAEASDLRLRIVSIAQIAIFIATVVVFSRWIYVAHANKWSLGATGMRFTPGWAIGSFFVPIINLYMPYQAMKELWLVSADPLQWQHQRRSAILPWWWLFWLVSGILGQASLRMSLRAEALADYIAANIIAGLTSVSGIALASLALALVGNTARMQLDQNRHMMDRPPA